MTTKLSIVLPVLNGARFLPITVPRLVAALDLLNERWEIVIVDDGSHDTTPQLLTTYAGATGSFGSILVVTLPENIGKFGALREGMARATGECCIFIDADLPFELSAISRFYRMIVDDGFDIVIGDRTLAESHEGGGSTPIRRAAHLMFSQLIRAVSLGGFADSQCGMKAYRADVAHTLFPLLLERRFSGDIEHLYLALKCGLAIGKAPVIQLEHGASTVSVLTAALDILRTMFLLPIRWRCGRYAAAGLFELGRASAARRAGSLAL